MKRATLLLLALAAIAAAADEKEARALPDGKGRDVVAKSCIQCHGAATFRKQRKELGEWGDTVDDMIDRGAKVPADKVEEVVAYLSKHFGVNAKVQMNTAPLEEIKSVLGFTVPEAQAVVEYRDAHGPYKEWRDVLKVQGVEASKVEGKKDAMAF